MASLIPDVITILLFPIDGGAASLKHGSNGGSYTQLPVSGKPKISFNKGLSISDFLC